MSHVVKVELLVKDLDALAVAANKCGCELVRNQKTYKWYGRFMGDYQMPEGMTENDLGKCDHAIRVKGAASHTYEVGVIKNKNSEGYSLFYDFFQGGYGLEEKVGKQMGLLKQEYTVQAILNKVKNKSQVRKLEEIKEGNKRKIVISLR